MTTLTERIPVEAINREAAEVRTGRAILTAIAAVFWTVGYAAGRVLPMVLWCCFAVRKGFRAAHGPSRRMQIEALRSEVAELKMQLSRFDVR